jgi:hypothetical protein
MAILFVFLCLGFFMMRGHYGPQEERAFHGGRESLFITASESADFEGRVSTTGPLIRKVGEWDPP